MDPLEVKEAGVDHPGTHSARLSADGRSVVVVVVTYNRRELLRKTLWAIHRQTMRPGQIVVLDNHSTDGTDAMLQEISREIPLAHRRMHQNIGGAGGFKAGIESAYLHGADWIWCMDDDCVAEPDALERLMRASHLLADRTPGFLASRVLWTDGSPCLMNLQIPYRAWHEAQAVDLALSRIVGSSFVSMLIARKAVESVGLPVAEFFIWFDDAEYSRRISRRFPCYLVGDSIVVHHTIANSEPLDFSMADRDNLWKFRYGVRNELSYYFRSEGFTRAIMFVLRVIRRMARSGCPPYIWSAMLRACVSGFRFDYPSLVAFPESATASSAMHDERRG